jgi:hypothetical protein
MMTTTRYRNAPGPCLRAVACALSLFAMGGALAEDKLQLTGASFLEIDELVIAAKGRPNEEHRLRGLKSYKTGHYRDALKSFEVAAYNADKYSQHYLSLMHWHGVGAERDPVQAYIWSDLAAERGSKPLLVLREKIWSQLTPEQQEQVQVRGEDFYDKYGDAVAKPRAESAMRQFARDMTGSRTGYRNQRLETSGPPVNGAFGMKTGSNAAAYAISERATPDELYGKDGGLRRLSTYWQQQDRLLEGKVEVGPLQNVPTPKGENGMNG